jgi:hypothetical protein
MEKAAEGLTAKCGVNFSVSPEKDFKIFAPTSGAPSMFSTTRGFDTYKLDRMEPVAIRFDQLLHHVGSVIDHPASLVPKDFARLKWQRCRVPVTENSPWNANSLPWRF